MRTITLEELLEAGCHFGHQVTRQNPKTRDFVFEARDNIHIIDLQKTKEGLEEAAAFIKQVALKPESTLIVLGTKRQAEGIVTEEVKRANSEGVGDLYAVTARWIGGTFSNFAEVTKNYKKLKDLTDKLKNEFEKVKFTKKEISLWDKERIKLERYYGGTKDMKKIPDAIFVIDTHMEALAVREARNMGVPVVGIVDTNADPDPVDHVIPANDDASGSIKLIATYIIDAWIEGKKKLAKGEERMANGKEQKEAEGKEQVANSKGQEANGKGLMANGEPLKQDTKKPEVSKAKVEKSENVKPTVKKAKKSEPALKKASIKKTTAKKAAKSK
jgi:small subunit ribosomal protein S2